MNWVKIVVSSVLRENIFTIDLYKKYLLPLSAITVAGLIFILFPGDAQLPPDIIGLMLIICALLFAASFISRKRNDTFNDVYVLLNLLIFFSLTNLSKPWLNNSLVLGNDNSLFLYLSAASIMGIVALFLFTKDKLFNDGRSLITGLDMIMLILIVFLLLVHNMVNIKGINFIGGNLILGFSIYIWYKILLFVTPNLTRPVYYLSFALPLFTLLIML